MMNRKSEQRRIIELLRVCSVCSSSSQHSTASINNEHAMRLRVQQVYNLVGIPGDNVANDNGGADDDPSFDQRHTLCAPD